MSWLDGYKPLIEIDLTKAQQESAALSQTTQSHVGFEDKIQPAPEMSLIYTAERIAKITGRTPEQELASMGYKIKGAN